MSDDNSRDIVDIELKREFSTERPPSTSSTPQHTTPFQTWRLEWRVPIVMTVICMGGLITALDAVIVGTALPSIARDLGATTTELAWVGASYLVASALLQPVWPTLSELTGRKIALDIGFVLFESVRLIRLMAELYGARPGTIGLIKLTRDVLGHLAVTGTIAIGDDVIGQVVGHGLAAKLSTRLGEGVVNGLLTARIGLAAMDLCRPMPFIAARRPKIGEFLSDLTALRGDAKKPQPAAC